ncbi:uncharacterized protein LOC106081671 [Stomoxys calcitrans]|uniref:uncharacterized protein LOC106081671 n=1 Tax=Stomoxys calcitrans TaxID=35570 RepID=UPI0027E21A76|nr:uncharacterized protein LOC106081671 [Stomoxys calcitrans]
MDLKIILFISAVYGFITPSTSAVCRVNIPMDPEARPIVLKKFGSHMLRIMDEVQSVVLNNNEEVTAFCRRKFEKPSEAVGLEKYTYKCSLTQRYYDYSYRYEDKSITMQCSTLKWSLYESTTPFKWCPIQFVSYVVAAQSGDEILGGICYNLEEMILHSLYAAVLPNYVEFLYPSGLLNYTKSVEIKEVNTSFIPWNILSSKYTNPQFEEWLQFASYQHHSLIQNIKMRHEAFDKLGGLLNIPWWTGLRLGNWHRYEMALETHIESGPHTYDILTGILNTISVPIPNNSCQEELKMVELKDQKNRTIPLYVWQYLKSTGNITDLDEIMIIGVNTPFQDFYDEKDLVFCEDICHKIDWLQKVHKTFRYKTMGIIFCCSYKEVRNTEHLQGFPMAITNETDVNIQQVDVGEDELIAEEEETITEPYEIDDEDIFVSDHHDAHGYTM